MQEKLCEIHQLGETAEWMVLASRCPALARHGILYCGASQAGRGYRFARERPPFGALFVCRSGAGRVWTASGWQRLTAGGIYATPPRVYHAYEIAPEVQAWEIAWFAFGGGASPGDWVATAEPFVRSSPGTEAFWRVLEGFRAEFFGPADPLCLGAWAELLAAEGQRLLRGGRQGDARLERVWRAVEAEPGADWTLPRLAALAALSSEQLRVLSHRESACSPMARVVELRMRKACQLLLRTEGSVKQVAAAVGYGNALAFSTAFRRVCGASPAAYRKQA